MKLLLKNSLKINEINPDVLHFNLVAADKIPSSFSLWRSYVATDLT